MSEDKFIDAEIGPEDEAKTGSNMNLHLDTAEESTIKLDEE